MGRGMGAYSSAKVADYVSSASGEIVDCLSNSDRISDFLTEQLKEKFNATVKKESHWTYWDL